METLTVKASMRTRQPVLVAIVPVNIELAETIHSLQLLEAVQRHFARARDKLQQLRALLLVEAPHGSPEPLNLWRTRRVVVILGVVLPIVHIDLRHTRDEEFEFLFGKDRDEVGRDNVIEAGQEGIELLLNGCEELVFRHEANVFVLVVLGDGYVAAVRDEVNGAIGAEFIDFDGERLGDDVGDVVFAHPDHGLVVLKVEGFHVLEGDGLGKDTLSNG